MAGPESCITPGIDEHRRRDDSLRLKIAPLMRLPYIVFKGGTSLSKAHKVIKRFSEDIDLASDKNLTLGEKKTLKNSIVEAADKLERTIQNLEDTRSRRQFNRYIMAYRQMIITPLRSLLGQIASSQIFPSVWAFYCASKIF